MKSISLVFVFFAVVNQSAIGQSVTRIYFFNALAQSITTPLNPEDPIKISRCTLLETDADSLGIPVFKDKFVYLHFERGKTYYYLNAGSGQNYYAPLRDCSENEFWLSVYFSGGRTYRHYILTKKTGLKLLEESRMAN